MLTIEIDGQQYEAEKGSMVIQVADANGIHIPRFCYHSKLSIAANCRMCLVEVEMNGRPAPKPLPACATPVADNMKVSTQSTKALSAQKSVMEFLLINHPLDCPICDQGGECELQDLSIGYGRDNSRYVELKRAVPDKDIGPLIATEMTRCIHCTRCVRFGDEIAGLREMGATGRGEHTEIGTYVAHSVSSELSGNVVDLCPVGALTAKPSRYQARAWEMQQYPSIAPHDAVGSNINIHVRRGKVLRVVPRDNEEINEIWLADRDRYSYEALYHADRLTQPMVRDAEGNWQATDWKTALQRAVDGFKQIAADKGAAQLGALTAANATVEEMYLLQKCLRGLGSNNIDHRLHQVDFSDQAFAPLYPALGQHISDLENLDAALIIGSHLRKEQPLLNHRLRKASLKGAAISVINPLAYEYNFKVAHDLVVAPDAMVANLASVAKALLDLTAGSAPAGISELLASANVTAEHQAIANSLQKGENVSILLGQHVISHPQLATLRALAAAIAQLSNAKPGYVGEAANTSGAWLSGCVPHRQAGGMPVKEAGLDANSMLQQGLGAYLLLGCEPELASPLGTETVQQALRHAFTVALTAYRSEALDNYADVMLPIALFPETSGTYVNVEGRWQSFNGAVAPYGDARPAWKVLRVMGNLAALDGFDYTSSEQIRDELQASVGDKTADNNSAWQSPEAQSKATNGTGVQRISELAMYAIDPMVRRAAALHATVDSQLSVGIHLNSAFAAQQRFDAGVEVTVQQNGSRVTLPVVIDDRVPNNSALLYVGQAETAALNGWSGQLTLSVG